MASFYIFLLLQLFAFSLAEYIPLEDAINYFEEPVAHRKLAGMNMYHIKFKNIFTRKNNLQECAKMALELKAGSFDFWVMDCWINAPTNSEIQLKRSLRYSYYQLNDCSNTNTNNNRRRSSSFGKLCRWIPGKKTPKPSVVEMVPNAFFLDLIHALENRDKILELEGIFRLSGSTARKTKIYNAREGRFIGDDRDGQLFIYGPNDLTGALKLLLTDSASDLKGKFHSEALIESQTLECRNKAILELWLETIDPARFIEISTFLKLAVAIAKNSDKNLMTPSNLGVSIGPSFFTKIEVSEQHQANHFMAELIELHMGKYNTCPMSTLGDFKFEEVDEFLPNVLLLNLIEEIIKRAQSTRVEPIFNEKGDDWKVQRLIRNHNAVMGSEVYDISDLTSAVLGVFSQALKGQFKHQNLPSISTDAAIPSIWDLCARRGILLRWLYALPAGRFFEITSLMDLLSKVAGVLISPSTLAYTIAPAVFNDQSQMAKDFFEELLKFYSIGLSDGKDIGQCPSLPAELDQKEEELCQIVKKGKGLNGFSFTLKERLFGKNTEKKFC